MKQNPREEMVRQLKQCMTACEWIENEEGIWDTACGESFVFDDGDIEANSFCFCPYCGKTLKAVPFVYPSSEEKP